MKHTPLTRLLFTIRNSFRGIVGDQRGSEWER